MMPDPKLKKLLARVFDDARGGLRAAEGSSAYAELRHDFVFHMTDWLQDLRELNDLYQHPEKAKLDDATIKIIGFLYHVIPHLKAAGRLLLDEIPDAFEDSTPVPVKRNGRKSTRSRKARPARTRKA
jgi:hypothetical protein